VQDILGMPSKKHRTLDGDSEKEETKKDIQ
jgi:hypothetical protein